VQVLASDVKPNASKHSISYTIKTTWNALRLMGHTWAIIITWEDFRCSFSDRYILYTLEKLLPKKQETWYRIYCSPWLTWCQYWPKVRPNVCLSRFVGATVCIDFQYTQYNYLGWLDQCWQITLNQPTNSKTPTNFKKKHQPTNFEAKNTRVCATRTLVFFASNL